MDTIAILLFLGMMFFTGASIAVRYLFPTDASFLGYMLMAAFGCLTAFLKHLPGDLSSSLSLLSQALPGIEAPPPPAPAAQPPKAVG